LHAQGRLPFDRLVKFYELDQVNEAMRDSETGQTIKPILRVHPRGR
jgi:aryl-alcohol dehydrogenase